jgi:hypothetical protein
MFELLGIPPQALFGQLLLGLINGSFYAVLSLGLAVIFGLLNIINFTHGAQYMMGAFVAWMLLNYFGIGYWWALLLAPVAVGITGIVIERTLLHRLYHLDHLYGLLLTFGLALIIQGLFRNYYGSSGLPYVIPPSSPAGRTSASCSCRTIAAGWLSPRRSCARHLVRDRAHQARRLPARRHREPGPGEGLRHQRAAADHPDLRLRGRPWRRLPGCSPRRSIQVNPQMGADSSSSSSRWW